HAGNLHICFDELLANRVPSSGLPYLRAPAPDAVPVSGVVWMDSNLLRLRRHMDRRGDAPAPIRSRLASTERAARNQGACEYRRPSMIWRAPKPRRGVDSLIIIEVIAAVIIAMAFLWLQ